MMRIMHVNIIVSISFIKSCKLIYMQSMLSAFNIDIAENDVDLSMSDIAGGSASSYIGAVSHYIVL